MVTVSARLPATRAPTSDGALSPLQPGPLIRIGSEPLVVDIAPAGGGRIAQIHYEGVEQLLGFDEANSAMIAWGCFPMVPWAGRIRHGRFQFDGESCQVPINLQPHAIHGLGFGLPWQILSRSSRHAELGLGLPRDERWPFGGHCRQHIEAGDTWLRLQLTLTANDRPMPAALGWHPWFHKPERIGFCPRLIYPRDQDGIASHPPTVPTPGPWDDCFVNERPVLLHRGAHTLRLSSSCDHWVVFDEPALSTCFEPQTSPPDAFNRDPTRLEPGQSLSAWFLLEWTQRSTRSRHDHTAP